MGRSSWSYGPHRANHRMDRAFFLPRSPLLKRERSMSSLNATRFFTARTVTLMILFIVGARNPVASAQIINFDNTPFDPNTWKNTITNTPFDPRTWPDAVESITNPAGACCEAYANNLGSHVVSRLRLSHAEKHYLRPWFGDLVDRVTIAWEVPLNPEVRVGSTVVAVSASAQTFGY